MRRRTLLHAAAWALALPSRALTAQPACGSWPAWDAFRQNFIGDGGRVAESDGKTVSEAQAYAMVFALAANDRRTFERLLRWTEDNLAAGDLTARLPAWHWGRRADGTWGVIDENPASDADLWMVWALGEAGRLWQHRRYVALASLMADRILKEETAELPGLGRTLLPGPKGFTPEPGVWKLNPSYVPLPVMRWLAARSGQPAWQALLDSSMRLLMASAPRGFVAEWVRYSVQTSTPTWKLDREEEGAGSYNAIRVYLWLGMTHPQDPWRTQLLEHYAPMRRWVQDKGVPPLVSDARTGQAQGVGPTGFSGALLPFLAASDAREALRQQQERLLARPPADDAYYDQALTLFGQGHLQGWLSLAPDGALQPAWTRCVAPDVAR